MLRIIFLLTFLVFLPSVYAQESASKIEARFYAFRYAPKLQSVYLRTGIKTYQKVELSTANIVGPLKVLINDGSVTIHKMENNEEGEVIYPVVGVVKVPASITKALIILAPANQEKSKYSYQTFVIDQKISQFPLGSYKLVNLSPYQIRGAIGSTRFIVQPSRVASFNTKGQSGQALPVLFQYRKQDRWRRLTETRWAHSKTSRFLLCSYFDLSTKRMKLRSIPNNTVKNKETANSEQ